MKSDSEADDTPNIHISESVEEQDWAIAAFSFCEVPDLIHNGLSMLSINLVNQTTYMYTYVLCYSATSYIITLYNRCTHDITEIPIQQLEVLSL